MDDSGEPVVDLGCLSPRGRQSTGRAPARTGPSAAPTSQRGYGGRLPTVSHVCLAVRFPSPLGSGRQTLTRLVSRSQTVPIAELSPPLPVPRSSTPAFPSAPLRRTLQPHTHGTVAPHGFAAGEGLRAEPPQPEPAREEGVITASLPHRSLGDGDARLLQPGFPYQGLRSPAFTGDDCGNGGCRT